MNAVVSRGDSHCCEICPHRSFSSRSLLFSHISRLHCYDKGSTTLVLKHPCRNFLQGARDLWNERPAIAPWSLYCEHVAGEGVSAASPIITRSPLKYFAKLVRHLGTLHPGLQREVCSEKHSLVPICCPGGTGGWGVKRISANAFHWALGALKAPSAQWGVEGTC